MKNNNIYTVETNSGSLSGAGAWYRLGAQTVVRVRMLPDFLYKEVYAMSIGELFILAVGLSMDAFAVAVCSARYLMRGHNYCLQTGFGLTSQMMPARLSERRFFVPFDRF